MAQIVPEPPLSTAIIQLMLASFVCNRTVFYPSRNAVAAISRVSFIQDIPDHFWNGPVHALGLGFELLENSLVGFSFELHPYFWIILFLWLSENHW